MADPRTLLSIVELGGYPDFTSLYEKAGYAVTKAMSVRKAIAVLKSLQPVMAVAEFNFQSDFRDRTSSLESLLAVIQQSPNTRVIVFYDKEHEHQLARVTSRFPIHATLAYPIQPEALEKCLKQP
jgi:ActR/RegA family two-component response regulator